MIEEVKELLGKLNFSTAAIVDDAYDETPGPEDLAAGVWDRFFDDMTDVQEQRIKDGYGAAQYDQAATPAVLGRDSRFVDLVWSLRDELGDTGSAVFADFLQRRTAKREALENLNRLLADGLKLPTQTMGRAENSDLEKAHVIFLDLFLGADNDPEAVKRSIDRIRQVVEKRRANPPVVFLMSESPHLAQFAPDVRDKAELLGCQFRTIKKSVVADSNATLELIYDLIVGYPDSQKINAFILAWDAALTDSRADFLKKIRTIDLADYANMHGLILEAEEQKLGDYVVDLYDLYLHNIIEGHEQLIRAAKGLNSIDWTGYPPRQFMPSEAVIDMTDGSLFHNARRTDLEAEIDADPKAIRFGDVFLAPPEPVKAPAPEGGPAVPGAEADQPAAAGPPPQQTQLAYVVMSQPCDLARDGVETTLLLRGKAQKYEWKQHLGKKTKAVRTPIMKSGGENLAVDWSPLTPHTWEMASLPELLAGAGLKRARRMRLAFALQLQRQFLDGTGRIGTQADLPGDFEAAVSVYLRTEEGKAKRILQMPAGNRNAVCLAGRTKDRSLDWLLLSDEVVVAIVDAMRATPEQEIPRHERKKFADAIKKTYAFRRAMKGRLPIKRDGKQVSPPLANTEFDTVEISTVPRFTDGAEIGSTGAAILIDLDVR